MKELSNSWYSGKPLQQFKCENCGNYPALAIAGCCGGGYKIDGPYCQKCWIGMIQAEFHQQFYTGGIHTEEE